MQSGSCGSAGQESIWQLHPVLGGALAGISFVTLSETPKHEKQHRAVAPMAVLLREPRAAGAGMATA